MIYLLIYARDMYTRTHYCSVIYVGFSTIKFVSFMAICCVFFFYLKHPLKAQALILNPHFPFVFIKKNLQWDVLMESNKLSLSSHTETEMLEFFHKSIFLSSFKCYKL